MYKMEVQKYIEIGIKELKEMVEVTTQLKVLKVEIKDKMVYVWVR